MKADRHFQELGLKALRNLLRPMPPENADDPGRRLRILHLEDNPTDSELIRACLEAEGIDCEIQRVDTKESFLAALEHGGYDLILSDYTLPSYDGVSAMHLAWDQKPDTPFIFISGTIGEERAVESLKTGAVDYVLKGNLQRLVPVIQRALRDARERSERLHIEEELHQHNELFHQITENADDLIAVLDLEGRRVFNSSSYRKYFGEPAALVGTDSFADIHPDDRERVWRIFRETVATGKGQRTEYRFRLQDGRVRDIESQGSVIRNKEGKVTRIVVVSRDVTERRQAELKMREQAALLDQAQDAIYVRDLDHRITFWNKGAEQLYGWTAAEVIGKHAAEVLCKPGSTHSVEAREAMVARGDSTGELTQMTKTGREITVVSRQTLLRDASGQPVSILKIDTDITEKKQLQDQFLRDQRLENIGALASGIAHDLNNILAPVMMVADLLRAQCTDEARRPVLDTLKTSARRGSELVNQILRFTRGDRSESVALDFKQLVKEMANLVKDTFPRSIQVQTHIAEDLRLVKGDATQLRQVLLNLCVNARDAIPESGTLSILASNAVLDQKTFPGQPQAVSGAFVLLAVSDTGTGIPPDLLDKIFQPFFTTKARDKGTGLGLFTVANIVRNHKGFIEVSSEPGNGSIFKIYLPATAKRELPPPEAAPAVPPAGRGEWILLADDELAIREMTEAMLEVHRYRVLSAKDGADALTLFQQHKDKISVVVTDLMMPIMDGPALIRQIRHISPETKIVCVSGLASGGKLTELDRSEVHALLSKPYTADELLAALGKLLGSA